LPSLSRRHPWFSSIRIVVPAIILAILASAIVSLAAPSDVLGADATKAAACSDVNLRERATTSGVKRTTLAAGTRVTVSATVTGSSWRASCAGKIVSGSAWYRVIAINGRSVKSLYGVTYLYGATGLFKAAAAAPAVAATATSTKATACSGVNLRRTARTTGFRQASLKAGVRITVTATVTGSKWKATCAGKVVSGSKWYRISAVNGQSVKSRYGVTYLYAATGLFKSVAAPPAPVPVPPPPTGPIEGIDVSHWQGVIDWTLVRAAGKRFAFIKASEDIDFVDDMYATNRAQAKAVGLLVGAYHFAQPDRTPGDAVAEADHFLNTALINSGELLPVLDLEVVGGLTDIELQDWVRAYLGRIYERTGVRGVIYMSPAFWANFLDDTTWFAANGYKVLWIAHWTTAAEPWVPGTDWGGQGWTFWQYTSSGAVPGIVGRVDLDRYAGGDFRDVLIP
jgi:GH25 family lysozyme M1 (1,4-beta-N-acetylmuramidase)